VAAGRVEHGELAASSFAGVNLSRKVLHEFSGAVEIEEPSAVSEAQAVIAMEINLEELEVWLVSCGRFSNNQQILLQIDIFIATSFPRSSKLSNLVSFCSSVARASTTVPNSDPVRENDSEPADEQTMRTLYSHCTT